jgi:hypothetical protein
MLSDEARLGLGLGALAVMAGLPHIFSPRRAAA